VFTNEIVPKVWRGVNRSGHGNLCNRGRFLASRKNSISSSTYEWYDIQLDNLIAFVEIQESMIEDLKKRVEQLEADTKVHPLKKLLKHYNLFM